jgi:hypothetical protein
MELLSLRRRVKDTGDALMASLSNHKDPEKTAAEYVEALREYREFIFRDLALSGKRQGVLRRVTLEVQNATAKFKCRTKAFAR